MKRTILGLLSLLLAGAAPQPPYQPPQHSGPPPFLGSLGPAQIAAASDAGIEIEQNRAPAEVLAEHRRLATQLAVLKPQRPGVVDAYVVAIALDSDAVFGREAREAAAVLSRRYDAAGRTLVLAGSDGTGPSTLPMGSPSALAAALARVAEVMDRREDVLVLYATSHGAPIGIVYNDASTGFGLVSPTRLWTMLWQLEIPNRLLLLSACYAGVFVPALATPTTAIVTAASATRTSFGCRADMDWTFFGDALINHGLRTPQPLAAAANEAQRLIGAWERQGRLEPSDPQVSIGADVQRWLGPLEARMPRERTPLVGRPAVTILTTAEGG